MKPELSSVVYGLNEATDESYFLAIDRLLELNEQSSDDKFEQAQRDNEIEDIMLFLERNKWQFQ